MGDWQLLLDDLAAKYVSVYSEDGVATSLPRATALWQKKNDKSLSLEVLLGGFTINCHFFDDSQVQFNLLPEDVDSLEKAETVFGFMKELSLLLHKEVLLTPEFGGAKPEDLCKFAVCVAEPTGQSITSRLDDVDDESAKG
jgi:hypothetical protein